MKEQPLFHLRLCLFTYGFHFSGQGQSEDFLDNRCAALLQFGTLFTKKP